MKTNMSYYNFDEHHRQVRRHNRLVNWLLFVACLFIAMGLIGLFYVVVTANP